MQFIDEVKIYLKAGDGGNGIASFRREKFIERGGPDGGDGGRGGDIILKSDNHLNTLVNYRYKQHFTAENGKRGGGKGKTGRSGENLILKVPVGTQIFTESGHLIYDFVQAEEEFVLLKGGTGGIGNIHFKSSTNRAPRQCTDGELGEELTTYLKMKMLSDVGLLGLPNSGKSSFLHAVSRAKPKIADYPFTTLKPVLGVVSIEEEELVVADIPGLIEGASEGVGLGHRFLKHIERCRVLLHLVDATGDNIAEDFRTIRQELVTYKSELTDRPILTCLNKIDLLSEEEIEEKKKILEEEAGEKIYLISAATRNGLETVLHQALQFVQEAKEENS